MKWSRSNFKCGWALLKPIRGHARNERGGERPCVPQRRTGDFDRLNLGAGMEISLPGPIKLSVDKGNGGQPSGQLAKNCERIVGPGRQRWCLHTWKRFVVWCWSNWNRRAEPGVRQARTMLGQQWQSGDVKLRRMFEDKDDQDGSELSKMGGYEGRADGLSRSIGTMRTRDQLPVVLPICRLFFSFSGMKSDGCQKTWEQRRTLQGNRQLQGRRDWQVQGPQSAQRWKCRHCLRITFPTKPTESTYPVL